MPSLLLSSLTKARYRSALLRLAKSRSISSANVPLLLSPQQLHELVPSGNVSMLDASWFMPNAQRKPREEFLARRIPGAQFLDLDEVASPHDLGLKHMMPTERLFADSCEKFGIDPSSHVVIYDTHGVFSSPRALFMFRAFGHQKSSVLDGGLPRWKAEGFPLETKVSTEAIKTQYPTPVLDSVAIKSYDQIVSNSCLNPNEAETAIVLDARSRGRYLGSDPEPRPGLSSGHMPNSISLPFNAFLETRQAPDSTNYTVFLSPSRIRQELVDAVGQEEANSIISGSRSVITSCGSGMTAGILWLGLKLLGTEQVGLYDESWTGYAMRQSSKIEKVV